MTSPEWCPGCGGTYRRHVAGCSWRGVAPELVRWAASMCERESAARQALREVLALPFVAAEFVYLDRGIGTKTPPGDTLVRARAVAEERERVTAESVKEGQ